MLPASSWTDASSPARDSASLMCRCARGRSPVRLASVADSSHAIGSPGAFTTAWDAVAVFHPYKDWDEQTCSENNIDHETGKPMAGMPVDDRPAF